MTSYLQPGSDRVDIAPRVYSYAADVTAPLARAQYKPSDKLFIIGAELRGPHLRPRPLPTRPAPAGLTKGASPIIQHT